MTLTQAQLASKAVRELERAELWQHTEAAIAKLSVNDKVRADRIGRQTNDEYLCPQRTLAPRILFQSLATRQAAFWMLAMKRAEHYEALEADLVDNTTY